MWTCKDFVRIASAVEIFEYHILVSQYHSIVHLHPTLYFFKLTL